MIVQLQSDATAGTTRLTEETVGSDSPAITSPLNLGDFHLVTVVLRNRPMFPSVLLLPRSFPKYLWQDQSTRALSPHVQEGPPPGPAGGPRSEHPLRKAREGPWPSERYDTRPQH